MARAEDPPEPAAEAVRLAEQLIFDPELAGAVVFGFGIQNVVNNFVSGLILLYECPIQVGDSLEIGGLPGEVKRIGIRSSTVRTWDGAEVIVPNGSLISDTVTNWTLSDRQRWIRLHVVSLPEGLAEAVRCSDSRAGPE